MTKRWNTDMYIKYIDEKHSSFEVRGEYINNNTKTTLYHKSCGREFDVTPANFKTRGRCSLCNHAFKKTTQGFKKEVSDLVGDEYLVTGEYVTAKSKISILHTDCSHEYTVRPDDFLSGGTRCPKCFGNIRKTTEQYESEVKTLFGNTYVVLGEYSNTKTSILMMHNEEKCQHEFMVSPDAFLRGSHCNKCGTEKRSGKFHYKYNPNLTNKERDARDMQNGEIRKWRNKVYKRDNYTCQACHEQGGRLNAHHLYSWDKHEDYRFDVENGITLCQSCHKDFHRSYGYGGNTPVEFKHYLTTLK